MKKTRHPHISRELKHEIAASPGSMAERAARWGVTKQTIYNWIGEAKKAGLPVNRGGPKLEEKINSMIIQGREYPPLEPGGKLIFLNVRPSTD